MCYLTAQVELQDEVEWKAAVWYHRFVEWHEANHRLLSNLCQVTGRSFHAFCQVSLLSLKRSALLSLSGSNGNPSPPVMLTSDEICSHLQRFRLIRHLVQIGSCHVTLRCVQTISVMCSGSFLSPSPRSLWGGKPHALCLCPMGT